MHPATSASARPATPTTGNPDQSDLVQLHAQAVNALRAALVQLTSPGIETDSTAFSRALARSLRATAALKQACAGMANTAISGVSA